MTCPTISDPNHQPTIGLLPSQSYGNSTVLTDEWTSEDTPQPTDQDTPERHAGALVAYPGKLATNLLKRSETYLATRHARETAVAESRNYRVAESPRTTPCQYVKPGTRQVIPCQTPVRVKIAEPVMYWRLCAKCGTYSYYSLAFIDEARGVLTFRWVTEGEYQAWVAEALADCEQSGFGVLG